MRSYYRRVGIAIFAFGALAFSSPGRSFAAVHAASFPSRVTKAPDGVVLAAPRRHSAMGMDAFGHTQLAPDCAPLDRKAVLQANSVIMVLRRVLPQYRNQQRARAAGFAPDGPDVSVGALKHWISPRNVQMAWTKFDPARPSALLYRNTGKGYKLAGAMYTAPIAASFLTLNERIPLGLAHWHAHRNICVAGPDANQSDPEHRRQFGFSGSIADQASCEHARGRFLPNVYGWMVHVYPFEKNLSEQFS